MILPILRPTPARRGPRDGGREAEHVAGYDLGRTVNSSAGSGNPLSSVAPIGSNSR
jgi:hypothetical protein